MVGLIHYWLFGIELKGVYTCSEAHEYDNSGILKVIKFALRRRGVHWLRAECTVLNEELHILASCFLSPTSNNSVSEELRVETFAVITDVKTFLRFLFTACFSTF